MVGVFSFPVKPEDKDYPYYKTPKKVLEIDDSEITALIRLKKIGNFVHWQEDWNNLTDKEIIEKINQHEGYSYSIGSRKTGLGYQSEDRSRYLRIVRQRYSWFRDRLM